MNTRKLSAILVLACAALVIAGVKVSQLTRTISIQSNSRFLTSTQDAVTGRWFSRYIEADDLATNLSRWGTNSGGSGSSGTNFDGIRITNNATVGGFLSVSGLSTNESDSYFLGSIFQDAVDSSTFGILTAQTVTLAVDDPYGIGWNGSTAVPTKNAVYDKIQTLSTAGGTNNPTTISGPALLLITSQTISYQMVTNASFEATFVGSSNASTIVGLSVSNSSSSGIYLTNLQGWYDYTVGSNVSIAYLPPVSRSKLIWGRDATLGWEMHVRPQKKLPALVPGVSVLATTSAPLNTITWDFSGSSAHTTLDVTNRIRYGVTNIYVTNTAPVIADLAVASAFRLFLETNGSVVFSNTYAGLMDARLLVQQDTNGQRTVNWSVAGGLLQTNSSLQPTTNANALDVLEVMGGFHSTNVLAFWPQNFQPRVAFTNSLVVNSPDLISGLTVWLKADDLGYANGSYVSNWTAAGTTTFAATNQPGGTTQWPIYTNTVAALSGHAVVGFSASSPILYSSTITIGANTMFVVSNPGDGNHVMAQIDAVNQHTMLLTETGLTISRRGWGSSYDASMAAANGTYQIFHSLVSTESNQVYRAGSPGTANLTTAATPKTSGALRLGAYAPAQYTLSGGIAEVIIYNRVLPPSEQNMIGQYLSVKYGLTWSNVP